MKFSHRLSRIAKHTIAGKSAMRSFIKHGRAASIALAAFLCAVVSMAPLTASADTQPPAGTPATVSADPLPSVQVDGIIWDSAISGNTVYATGNFSTARPAGVALGGAGTVSRGNLIAYDITTGVMSTTFVHSLNGEGRSIAVSPDGSRVYVGGNFTTVDGQTHNHFAAFAVTPSSSSLLSGFSGTNAKVNAIAATGSMVYVGGTFSSAAGQTRQKLAAYNADGSLNTGWRADVTGANVAALAVAAPQGNLIVGGSFSAINGATYYSSGAVKLANGANVPWGSQSSSYPIRLQPPAGASASSLGVTSLTADATQVYLTAFTFVSGSHPGSFEGTAAIDPSNGAIIWVNDCAGDTYDSFPVGQVLYSVSHAHNCSPIGGYPNTSSQRALAETTYATGTITTSLGGNYPSFVGQQHGTLLNWFPILNTGTVSGSNQAAWTVTGNSQYIALGGEFTKAGSLSQQGIVRYAVASVAPNKIGPSAYAGPFNNSGYAVMPHAADSTGTSVVRVYNTSDLDNRTLTYEVRRVGSSTVVGTGTLSDSFWQASSFTFNDTGLTPGTSALYTLTVKDPYGNSRTVSDPTIINDTDNRFSFSGSDWTSSQSRGDTQPDFARGIHYASRDGASWSYTFSGTSVKLIGEKSSNRGSSSVTIDGSSAGTINQNATSTSFQQTIFNKTGLTSGTHTIKVTKTGGTYIDIDGIVVR